MEEAKSRIKEIIEIYNALRPHLSCDMLTPDEAHFNTGKLKKHWKKYAKKYSGDRFLEASVECMNIKAEVITPAHANQSDYSLSGYSSAEPDSASSDKAKLQKV